MSFLTKKKRLRQAASWRDMVLMSFFIRNVIFDQKKGACGKPPAGGKWFWCHFSSEMSFLTKKRRLRQAASQREMVLIIFDQKKGWFATYTYFEINPQFSGFCVLPNQPSIEGWFASPRVDQPLESKSTLLSKGLQNELLELLYFKDIVCSFFFLYFFGNLSFFRL